MSDQPQGPGWWRATDGRWYPPQSTPGAAPPAGGDRTRVVLWVVLVALVVAAGAVGAVLLTRDDGESAGGGGDGEEVLLEPLASDGPDAFMASTTTLDLGEALPTTLETVVPDDGEASASGGVSLVGTDAGLYGGSRSNDVCDTALLVGFLADPAHADQAAAWAGVQGVAVDGIADYVAGLTPTVLRVDTLVTNHGFDAESGATARQSVLQAGTAVLVDDTGTPRVRCACGNPLLAPMVGSGYSAEGEPWQGWSAGSTATVVPGTPVEALTLIDVETGETYEQPVGGGDIRSIDVLNRTYDVDLCGGDQPVSVEIVDGSGRIEVDGYGVGVSLDRPQYGDLTGDGRDDVLLTAQCIGEAGSGQPYLAHHIGRLQGSELIVIGNVVPPLELGRDLWPEMGEASIDGGRLRVEWAVATPETGTCCPTMQLTTWYRYDPATDAFVLDEQSDLAPLAGAPAPTTAQPPATTVGGPLDCGIVDAEFGIRAIAIGISCERAAEVLAAYDEAPKQGSSAFADVLGFQCWVDTVVNPAPGAVTGGCEGSEGIIELRLS